MPLVEPSLSFPNPAKNRTTTWDTGRRKKGDEVHNFHDCMKALHDQHVTAVSAVSALQAGLVKARSRIRKLEAERRSNKNKFELFLNKLNEEKRSWKRREHENLCMVDELEEQLNRERKSCQRMLTINSKLIDEVADAKLAAKLLFEEYERERKSRELMEEVCNELAKEIAEDKAEVEAIKKESIKMQEEVEEERRMLQLAEVWREERVQMKLFDAKLTLEDKYSQISKLLADLEASLGAPNASSHAKEFREAELIQQLAANPVKIDDASAFSYAAPKSYDIFSIVKELKRGEMNEKQVGIGVNYHLDDHASKPFVVSLDGNGLYRNSVQTNSLSALEEAASNLETATHVGNVGQTFPPEMIGREREKIQHPGSKINEVSLVTRMRLQDL